MDEQTIDEECTDGYGYTHRHHEPSAFDPQFCKRCGQRLEEDAPEPPEPDGECFRGGEAAAYLAETQARIQRELK